MNVLVTVVLLLQDPISDLDSDDPGVREAAAAALEKLGEKALPVLEKALADPKSSVELKTRARELIRTIELRNEGRIVFERGQDLWSILPDGTSEKQLARADGKTRWCSSPAWSPDGSSIAYLSCTTDEQTTLHLIDPDGKSIRSYDAPSTFSFAWTPDGKRLAMTRTSQTGLYMFDANGTSETSLQGPSLSIT